MAARAGWDKIPERKIEVSKSRTPLRDAPDLCSVAVLYVTDAEARAIGELAMMLQDARRNGQDQFVVGVRRPMMCRNGHPNQIEGELCRECERDAALRVRLPAAIWRPSAWAECVNGHLIRNVGDVCLECTRAGLAPIKVGVVLDSVPFGWTLEFNPSENGYFLLDQDRTPRAAVQKQVGSGRLVVIRVLGPTPEPEPEKIVGDAARFAGIDFND